MIACRETENVNMVLLLVSALVFLTGNPVTAPMIYTMF